MKSLEFAESIRQATLQAALDAYEDAGIQGLCVEGRWEAAVSAMRGLDLGRMVGDSRGEGGIGKMDR